MSAWVVALRSLNLSCCSAVVLNNVVMTRMLLYPPSDAKAFLPAAYQTSPGVNVTLVDSTIITLCKTLSTYQAYINTSNPSILSVRPLHHHVALSCSMSINPEHVWLVRAFSTHVLICVRNNPAEHPADACGHARCTCHAAMRDAPAML